MKECKECGKLTANPKYCSNSCSAKQSNENRVVKCPNKETTKIVSCVECGSSTVINVRASAVKAKCEVCKGRCAFCGNKAVLKLSSGNLCCSETYNACPEVKRKNSIGLKRAYAEGRKRVYLFTEDELLRSNRKITEKAKLTSFESSWKLTSWAREYLIKERGEICERCSLAEWLGEPLTLEVDHIDGNTHNNKKENLRVLCPNCHSQTSTWKGKNGGNSKKKYDEEQVIRTFKEVGNIHKTLEAIGLTAKGANYQTIKKILLKHQIPYFDKPD